MNTLFMRGYTIWRDNLNICIPFVLMYLTRLIYSIMVFAGVTLVIGVDILNVISESMSELVAINEPQAQLTQIEAIMEIIAPFVDVFIVAGIVLVLGWGLINAIFKSGAYAMIHKALQYNTTGIEDLKDSIRANALNMYIADILKVLLIMAGIVLIVPGGVLLQLAETSTAVGVIGGMLFFIGIIAWSVAMIFISFALVEMDFILVAKRLNPFDAIKESYRFFIANRMDVLIMWLMLMSIGLVYSAIMNLFSAVPVVGAVAYIIDMLIATLLISPLFSIWWMRLYMDRSSGELYMNELLKYP